MIPYRFFRTLQAEAAPFRLLEGAVMDEKNESGMGEVIRIDVARIRDHLGEMVRGAVEEALNAMLNAEADRLCNAGRYERSEGRRDRRAWSYLRALETKAGKVNLEGAEAMTADVRDGDHRALPAARDLGRGSLDRDVPGRRLGAPGRGHHRSAVGDAGQPQRGLQSQQDDLRDDRSLEAIGRSKARIPMSSWTASS